MLRVNNCNQTAKGETVKKKKRCLEIYELETMLIPSTVPHKKPYC